MVIPGFSNDANVNGGPIFYDGPNFYDDCDMDVDEEFVECDISLLLMLPHASVDDWLFFSLRIFLHD